MLEVKPISQSAIANFRQRFDDAYFRDNLMDQVYLSRLRYFGIYDSTHLVGGFVLYEGGRGPLKTLITPPFYPNIGLYITKADIPIIDILDCLHRFARAQYICFIKMDLPLAYHLSTPLETWQSRWTYRLSLNQTVEKLMAGIGSKIKSSYHKAVREGCIFRETQNKNEIILLIRSNLDQKNVRYKIHLLDNILGYFSEHADAHYYGTYKEEKLIAANIIFVDRGVAYHLFSAFDRSLSLNYANAAHLLTTILHIKQNHPAVHTFDFEGSTIPAIDFYFRRFGGIQCKYMSLYYSRLPAIFKPS